MTEVDFYVLGADSEQNRFHFACRLADKAFKQGHHIYLHTDSEDEGRQLDDMLWHYKPSSFIPHSVLNTAEAVSQVAIGWGNEPGTHNDLLINLGFHTPDFFSRFHRVGEIVNQQTALLDNKRQRYKFYRANGYLIRKHDL